MEDKIYSLACLPGIQRDGTTFSSRNYIDGQWCRFYRGLPKKIGGYRKIFENNNIPRGIYIVSNPPYFNIYVGDSDGLHFAVVDEYGALVNDVIYDRTPDNFQSSNYNRWSFNTLYSTIDDSALIIAQATQNLDSIDSQVATPIYYGNLNPRYDTTTRRLNGLAFASEGIARYAFDDNSTTSCTQTFQNGWINYQWEKALTITTVGIQSNGTDIYTLDFEVSDDGFDWVTVQQNESTTFFDGVVNYITVLAPQSGTYFRITETDGGILDIQELYFNTLSVPLIPTGLVSSGGFTVIGPFVFAFGNSGDVTWTQANDVTSIVNSARITGQKIVAGMPTRGGSYSPGGLFWSLDSVIRVYYQGPTSADFQFDTVTGQSSILSSKSIIEHDSLFYWIGTDRFLTYNGVVQELPNSMNLNYFFDNLNYAERQKVHAQRVSKWGEIWWFYPSGTATECDRAIIYNVRLQTWYDTAINRSSGDFEEIFVYPVWGDNTANSDGAYNIWQQEYGIDSDQTDDANVRTVSAIESYFETGSIAWVATDVNQQSQNLNRWVELFSLEPDFTGSDESTSSGQGGNISLTVRGKQYARSESVDSDVYTISPTTEKLDIREQRREMTLLFNSNEVGGDYEMGQVLIMARIGDTRS